MLFLNNLLTRAPSYNPCRKSFACRLLGLRELTTFSYRLVHYPTLISEILMMEEQVSYSRSVVYYRIVESRCLRALAMSLGSQDSGLHCALSARLQVVLRVVQPTRCVVLPLCSKWKVLLLAMSLLGFPVVCGAGSSDNPSRKPVKYQSGGHGWHHASFSAITICRHESIVCSARLAVYEPK